jgi:SOS-response transcriptional repressor LexA
MKRGYQESAVKEWAVREFERVKVEQGVTQAKLGIALGISQPQARALLYGDRAIKADEIPVLEQFFGAPFQGDRDVIPVEVPLLSWVSAGALSSNGDQDEALGTVRATGLEKGDWIALRVEGSSMNRISPPESVIFVNRADKELVPNGLYVIADSNGAATYKRYRPDPPRFEPVSTVLDHETIYPENEPTVIGRVRRSTIEM